MNWAWYSGGWTQALAGNPDPLFQFHHQPFAYFTKYADGTTLKAAHLKDETDFMAAGCRRRHASGGVVRQADRREQ